MFEDLKEQKTEAQRIEDLEKRLLEGYDILKEAKEKIDELETENKILDRKWNNAYQDARRMGGILTKEIAKDRLDKICEEQEDIEKILQDNNILDED